jgi:hypothetical protein
MKSNVLTSSVRGVVVLATAAALGGGLTQAVAGTPPVSLAHISGLLNDYSPAHVNGAPVKGAPYEMRGKWSLDLQLHSLTATFSAALNMETTDAGVVSQDDPTTRGAHTHTITMAGPISTDTSKCPASDPANPLVAWRFSVTGLAQITGNGNQAPFQLKGGPSNLQVCVGGGVDGTLLVSNVTLVLGAPANTHFGPQPIHGVVTLCAWDGEIDSSDCILTW